MTTFKQLEALISVIDSGSFENAASTLQIAQSAVSKHIRDLEEQFGYPLFDRSQRAARLTVEGNEILHRARELIAQRDRIGRHLQDTAVVPKSIRLGVTEITAASWLPAWITGIKAEFPELKILPFQSHSTLLKERLFAGQLDIIVIPELTSSAGLIKTHLQAVDFSWVCRSDLGIAPRTSLSKIALPLCLLQDDEWDSAYQYKSWIAELGGNPANIISSESLQILLSLAFSGQGITFIHKPFVEQWLVSGKLMELKIPNSAKKMKYSAFYRTEAASPFHERISKIGKSVCSFSTPFSSY